MPIAAKRLDSAGAFATIQLSDDPSDSDLINALGGKGDLVTRGWIRQWEVLTTTEDGSDTLIIGRPPYVGTAPKRRTSCTLTDAQATKLVQLVNEGWFLLD